MALEPGRARHWNGGGGSSPDEAAGRLRGFGDELQDWHGRIQSTRSDPHLQNLDDLWTDVASIKNALNELHRHRTIERQSLASCEEACDRIEKVVDGYRRDLNRGTKRSTVSLDNRLAERRVDLIKALREGYRRFHDESSFPGG